MTVTTCELVDTNDPRDKPPMLVYGADPAVYARESPSPHSVETGKELRLRPVGGVAAEGAGVRISPNPEG